LTPHLHVLLPEAQWRTTSLGEQHGSGEVVEVAPPTDDDVAAVLARVLRQAKKDFADLDAAWPEDEYEKGQRESLQRRRHREERQRSASWRSSASSACAVQVQR
jgi:hypothetical protein